MSYIPPAVEHVAKKIARIEGVEQSFVCRDGAVDAIIEGGYNRPLRSHLLEIGMRAMVPVRVFYRMEDGRAIGESVANKPVEDNYHGDDFRRALATIERKQHEAIEDYYTDIRIANFAGEPAEAPPDQVAGDAYSDKDVKKDTDSRDDYGQLKLTRIRASSRGRPVVGWRYGDHTLQKGAQVKFRKNTALQWTDGRTMKVRKGATAVVTDVASKSPIAFLAMGGYTEIELPVHAVGHVYDIMVNPQLESMQCEAAQHNAKLGYLTPELKRLVMTVGFGRRDGDFETKKNSPHFRGQNQPDMIGYQGIDDAEEDYLGDKERESPKSSQISVDKKGSPVDPGSRGAVKKTILNQGRRGIKR